MAEDLAAAVDRVLAEAVASGNEVGAQVSVIHHGRTLVDAVYGIADPVTGTRVDHDTLFWAASTAKGVTSTVAHVLIDDGTRVPPRGRRGARLHRSPGQGARVRQGHLHPHEPSLLEARARGQRTRGGAMLCGRERAAPPGPSSARLGEETDHDRDRVG